MIVRLLRWTGQTSGLTECLYLSTFGVRVKAACRDKQYMNSIIVCVYTSITVSIDFLLQGMTAHHLLTEIRPLPICFARGNEFDNASKLIL